MGQNVNWRLIVHLYLGWGYGLDYRNISDEGNAFSDAEQSLSILVCSPTTCQSKHRSRKFNADLYACAVVAKFMSRHAFAFAFALCLAKQRFVLLLCLDESLFEKIGV